MSIASKRVVGAGLSVAVGLGLGGCSSPELAPVQPDSPLTTAICRSVGTLSSELGMYANIPAPAGKDVFFTFGGVDEATGETWRGGEIVMPGYAGIALLSTLSESGLSAGTRSYQATQRLAELALVADDKINKYMDAAPQGAMGDWKSPFYDQTNLDNAGVTSAVSAARLAVEQVGVEYCGHEYLRASQVAEEYQKFLLPADQVPKSIFKPVE